MASKILATRKNDILKEREEQIQKVLLAYHGGENYISEALCRFPCETTNEFKSRKRQAFLTNYLRRITEQINQHLFQIEPKRDTIDLNFYYDVSMTGDDFSINDFMFEVDKYLTISGWCWIRVDRLGAPVDENGEPIEQTISLKEERGDRIYLALYNANEVVDWAFDAKGNLSWILTEEWHKGNNNDPFVDCSKTKIRTLYKDGKANVYKVEQKANGEKECVELSESTYSLDYPPFILVGKPNEEPHPYDDLERIQSSLLNLQSSYNYALWRSHFSVLVLAESCVRSLMEDGVNDQGDAVDLIVSEGRALTEDSDTKGLTRFISPSGSDRSIIPEQVKYLKDEMFETVGMFMRKSGRDAESAEAKAFDYKQIEAFLKQRAIYLETIESKIVQMAMELDPDFQFYDPFYNKDFSIKDLKKEMETLILGLSLDIPSNAKNEIKKQAFQIVSQLPSSTIADEVKEAVLVEIGNMIEDKEENIQEEG